LGIHEFADANKKVPPVESGYLAAIPMNSYFPAPQNVQDPGPAGTLFFHILPFIEQGNTYKQAFNTSPPSSHNVGSVVIGTYLCPSDPSATNAGAYGGCGVMQSDVIQRDGFASSCYAANAMVFDPRNKKNLETSMPDGTTNVVIIAERYKNCSPDGSNGGGCTLPAWAWNTQANGGDCWSSPTFGGQEAGFGNLNCGGAKFTNGSVAFQGGPSVQACNWYVTQGNHQQQMLAGLGDASVRGVAQSMSVTTWDRACRPFDGQVLGPDFNN